MGKFYNYSIYICDDAQENQSDVAISETSVKAH